jgi:hypothetical protein
VPTASKVLQLNDVIFPDNEGHAIANTFQTWDTFRSSVKAQWKELYRYIYATDTSTTTNSGSPWKNSTTIPKLTQIRDNLYANYMATMFPKRKWLKWEGSSDDDEAKDKSEAILAYMSYVIENPEFKNTVSKLVLDYIDNGNVFATTDWMDERAEQDTKIQTGYVGPVVRRVSPSDIVMNPVAPDFSSSPKIIRSLISLGDLEELLQRLSLSDGEREANKALFHYLKDIRLRVSSFVGDLSVQDDFYQVDGFTSFRNYLESGYAEVLTFYGDLYIRETGEFLKNHIIQVVDRHKVIRKEPINNDFGRPQIFHSGWRPRQDNLWAMGPLDNLVGMQYRLDHIENLKADFFDLVYAPPLKIKGYVEDFRWAPFEKIYMGDDGDVEVMQPTINPLQANFELDRLAASMEEMAGAPKEAMGFRTPGEKTAYEVQRLENAASRIFQNKIAQFEEQILEPLLNAMLEEARRKLDSTTIRIIDDEYKIATFMTLTADDIAGSGRIRPVAARHFVENAERVQNITAFFSSPLGQDPMVNQHISSIKLAELFFDDLLQLEDYKLVEPYIRLTEQAESQQISLQHEEDTMMGIQTPSGLTPEDSDESFI